MTNKLFLRCAAVVLAFCLGFEPAVAAALPLVEIPRSNAAPGDASYTPRTESEALTVLLVVAFTGHSPIDWKIRQNSPLTLHKNWTWSHAEDHPSGIPIAIGMSLPPGVRIHKSGSGESAWDRFFLSAGLLDVDLKNPRDENLIRVMERILEGDIPQAQAAPLLKTAQHLLDGWVKTEDAWPNTLPTVWDWMVHAAAAYHVRFSERAVRLAHYPEAALRLLALQGYHLRNEFLSGVDEIDVNIYPMLIESVAPEMQAISLRLTHGEAGPADIEKLRDFTRALQSALIIHPPTDSDDEDIAVGQLVHQHRALLDRIQNALDVEGFDLMACLQILRGQFPDLFPEKQPLWTLVRSAQGTASSDADHENRKHERQSHAGLSFSDIYLGRPKGLHLLAHHPRSKLKEQHDMLERVWEDILLKSAAAPRKKPLLFWDPSKHSTKKTVLVAVPPEGQLLVQQQWIWKNHGAAFRTLLGRDTHLITHILDMSHMALEKIPGILFIEYKKLLTLTHRLRLLSELHKTDQPVLLRLLVSARESIEQHLHTVKIAVPGGLRGFAQSTYHDIPSMAALAAWKLLVSQNQEEAIIRIVRDGQYLSRDEVDELLFWASPDYLLKQPLYDPQTHTLTIFHSSGEDADPAPLPARKSKRRIDTAA